MNDASESSGAVRQKKRAFIGSLLSLMPGCGHFYFRQWFKGFSLLLIDAAVLAGIFLSNAIAIKILMVVIYAIVLYSAISDMKSFAGLGNPHPFQDSKGYIAFLLITTGINALPLLWQSKAYGKGGKILWTLAVPTLAILFFGGIYLIARGG